MWFGRIIVFNIWDIVWPNQKKALGILQTSPELKVKSAKIVMLISRTNTLLSIPVLYCMLAAKIYTSYLLSS